MADPIAQRMDILSRRWDDQKNNPVIYPKPNILLAFYNGKWFTTIDDSKTISLFLSEEKQIFAGATFKCDPMTLQNGRRIYNIRPNAIQIISCAKGTSLSPQTDFVINVIAI